MSEMDNNKKELAKKMAMARSKTAPQRSLAGQAAGGRP